MARVIQEHIKKPLAEELLFGKLMKGGTVLIDEVDGTLTFDYPADARPKPPAKRGKNKGKEKEKVPEVVR